MKATIMLQRLKAVLFVFILVLAGATTIQAQTIFVNNQTGSNGNSGTTVGAPKLDIFGVNGAHQAAAATNTISVANTGVSYAGGTLTKALTFTSTGGSVTLTTLLNVGAATAFTGPFVMPGITLTTGAVTGGGNITIATGGTVTRTAGTVDASFAYQTTAALAYNGAAAITAGPEFPAANATTTLTQSGGAFTLTVPFSRQMSGVLTVPAGYTLALGGNTLTIAAVAAANAHAVQGTITTTAAGSLTLGATTGSNTFAGVLTGILGNVTVTGGNATGTSIDNIVGNLANNGAGLVSFQVLNLAGAGLEISGNVSNTAAGSILLNDTGAAPNATFGIGGSLTNSGSGEITFGTALNTPNSDETVTIAGSVTNSGTINNVTNNAALANAGNINFGTGALAITGAVTNSPTFTGTKTGTSSIATSGNITFAPTVLGIVFTGIVSNSPTNNYVMTSTTAAGDFTGNGRLTFASVTTPGDVTFNGGLTNASTGFVDNGATAGTPPTNPSGDVIFTARSTGKIIGTGSITNSSNAGGVNGDIDFRAAATGGTGIVMTGAATMTLSGTGTTRIITGIEAVTIPGAVTQSNTAATSMIDINAVAQNVSFGSVSLTGAGSIDFTPLVAGTISVTGAYNQTLGTWNAPANTGIDTFTGAFSVSGGTFTQNAAGDAAATSFQSTFTQSGGTVTILGTGAMSVTGNFSKTGGITDLGAGAKTLNLTGAANTFSAGTFANSALATMRFNRAVSAQTFTSGAGSVFPGNLTVINTFPNGPVWELNGGNLTVGRILTFTAVATGVTANLTDKAIVLTGALAGTFANAGGYTATATTGKVRMTDGAQEVGGLGAFFNLEIDLPAGDVVTTSTVNITNELRLTAGILTNTGGAVTVTGGTVFRGQGTFGQLPTYAGTVNVTYTTTVGPVVVTGAGNELTGTIGNVTLDFSGAATTLQLGAALTMTGVMTIPTGQILDLNNLALTAGTSIVANGNIIDTGAGAGNLNLTRTTGTAITGAGTLRHIIVAAASLGNTINGSAQLTGNVTMNGGALSYTPGTLPGGQTENIVGNLAMNLAAATFSPLANVRVGGNMLHTSGTIALGTNNITFGGGAAADAHTLGTTAAALFTGTGSLSFTNSATAASTLTTAAGGSTISVPVIVDFAVNADNLDIVTGPITFSNNVTLTQGVLDTNALVTTFTGNALVLGSGATGIGTLLGAAGGTFRFNPTAGTLAVTGVVNATSITVVGTVQVSGNTSFSGALTIPVALTHDGGVITQGGNLTVAGAYVRTGTGTYVQTATQYLVIGLTMNQGTSALSIANLRYNGGATALGSTGLVTVTGNMLLDGTGALDITNPGTAVALAMGAGANMNYVRGSFDVAPTMTTLANMLAMDGAVAAASTVLIPATVWPAAVTVTTFTVNRAAVATQIPGARTLQNELALTAGVLNLDAGGPFNLTVANSTLTVTAGTVTDVAPQNLIFTNPPIAVFNVNAAYDTGAGANALLTNIPVLASLTITRSANVANAVLTWPSTTTVTGAIIIRNSLTLTGTINAQGAVTIATDPGFALAAAPTVAGAGTLNLTGTAAQAVAGIGFGTIGFNNAAGITTTGAVAANNVIMTQGVVTLGGNLTVGGGAPTANSAAAASAGNLTMTAGRIVTGNFAVILDHEHTGAQGFIRNAGNTGCVQGNVRKLFDNAGGAGNGGSPDRMVFPVCDATGNYRQAAFTFTSPNTLTQGNWIQVSHTTGLPGGANGMPFNATDNAAAAYSVARYAPFAWFVQMNFNEQAGVVYDVELRAENYATFAGESIQRVRNIRRLAGLNTNFWSIISAAASGNDNFAVSATEPVSVSRGALGLLTGAGGSGNEGTIFTMGLESNMTVTNPAAVAVNAGQTKTVNLATVFGLGTQNGASPLYTYLVTNGTATIATGATALDVLTVTGVSAGASTITVRATDQLNDFRTATVTVNVAAAFAPVAVPAKELSLGGGFTSTTVDLTTAFSGGTAPVNYAPTSSNPAVAAITLAGSTLTITAVSAGTATITIVGTDGSAATATATVAVSVNGAFAAANQASTDVVEGANTAVTLSTKFSGGKAPYTYAAPVSAASNVTAATVAGVLTATVAEAYTANTTIGTVNVTVVGTDALGDTATFTLTVNVLPKKGDLDGQGNPSANSANVALKHFLGTQAPALTAKQVVAADFNSDAVVNPFDAYLIWVWPAAGKAEVQTESVLAFGSITREGNLVSLPIVVGGSSSGVASVSFSTLIDPSVAKVVSVTSDVEGWMVQNTISEDGTIRLAGIGLDALPADVVIATIQLQLNEGSAQFSVKGEGALNNNPISEIEGIEIVELPGTFALKGNYPNPFNPSTTIQFDLPETADVEVQIFDMVGRQVMTLASQSIQAGTNRSMQLNASALASGSYFYRVIAKMQSKTAVDTGRLTLIK